MQLPKFPFRSLSRWELATLCLFLAPLIFLFGVWVGRMTAP